MNKDFTNDHPFSCTLQYAIKVVQVAATIDNPYTFLSLTRDLSQDPSFELHLASEPNHSFVNTNNPDIELWATFEEVSTDLAKIAFKGLFFHDCTQITLQEARVATPVTLIV